VLVVLLAVASSLAYGVGDFAGGLAARQAPVLRVVAVTMIVSLAIQVALLPLVSGQWSAAAAGWGALAGLASAAGFALLYRSLALGPMSVLSPVTAVVSAVVPVAAGLAEGERLNAAGACGIAAAIAAILAISAAPGDRLTLPRPAALGLAIAAGTAIGAVMLCLSRSPADSGLIPLLACRAVSSVLLIPVALVGARRLTGTAAAPVPPVPVPPVPVVPVPAAGVTPGPVSPGSVAAAPAAPVHGGPGARPAGARPPARIATRFAALAVTAGALDAAANIAFLIAVRGGTLVIVAMITALYPAGTVLLARRVLRERLSGAQMAGLAAAAAAVLLLAVA
jgi:drug/metabolite transporter (DMT)-like permease